jgi:hypothetical protein
VESVPFISCRGWLLETRSSHLQQPHSNSHTEKLYILHRGTVTGARGGEKKNRNVLSPPIHPSHFFVFRIISSNLEATEYSLVERPTNNRQGCQPRNKSNFCDTHLPISCVFEWLCRV